MLTTFWSWWVIILTVTNLVLITWLLFANKKIAVNEEDTEDQTTGHVYDGIEEYDNPLPKWWFQMFVITLVFGVFYFALYPSLGNFKGFLNWTSIGQWEGEMEVANAKYAETFGQYKEMSIEEIAADPKAMKIGTRLFANNCSVCHGADGGGAEGFPNLTDKDWLYGGAPEQIAVSISNGRMGNMPPWGEVLGEDGVINTAEYVRKLSGLEHDAAKAEAGATHFATVCAACHGADGKGMHVLGAPNLTDDVWLYNDSREAIRHAIRNGRANVMPAQVDKLREDKIRMLTAYVYGLSQE
ncbi:MAG: cytochrome-c oxidase, cbb3-type subunit III [Cellvibrionaceae bacterium]|nr:cytochrome-c oxidase, cbb3-type subunit III [Cellvibrionaceae bacterium]